MTYPNHRPYEKPKILLALSGNQHGQINLPLPKFFLAKYRSIEALLQNFDLPNGLPLTRFQLARGDFSLHLAGGLAIS